MQKIYLAKPGAQKEGPFTLQQINHDLATRKITDTDFWAWHEGLPSWMPLYSVPGVLAKAWVVAAPAARPKEETPETRIAAVTRKVSSERADLEIALEPQRAEAATKPAATEARARFAENGYTPAANSEPASVPAPSARFKRESPNFEAATDPLAKLEPESSGAVSMAVAEPKPEMPQETLHEAKSETANPKPELELDSKVFVTPSMSSGKPFAALEQIFVLTTGEGPSAFKSEVTAAMLAEAAGEQLEDIRAKIPVDVIGGATAGVLETIRAGSIPGSAWRALLKIKPTVAKQAQDGAYHLCIRTFPVESKELVALFLLYNKETL